MNMFADSKTRRRVNKLLKSSGVKACSTCYVVRSLGQFRTRQPLCRGCQDEYLATRYAANAEQILEQQREYRRANIEQRREYDREYYRTNAEQLREKKREYYQANTTKVLEQQRKYTQATAEQRSEYGRRYRQENAEQIDEQRYRYRQANREELREKNREWKQANPDKIRTNNQRRRARKAAATVEEFTAADLLAYWDEIGAYGCVYCGGAYEHADHVQPLHLGGVHSMANILPACSECNLSKNAKDPVEYVNARYGLNLESP
ncbi:HNH endonuclease [Streptomyces sp. NBC_00208]|uniref:HNH endonuclease n=1 Tax=Streptomyces sp. NBC_00208 TaxID=2975681 RepID=UPI002E2C65A8|nr:HNH endonuclease [Streptomyces sp. NBC_00208]